MSVVHADTLYYERNLELLAVVTSTQPHLKWHLPQARVPMSDCLKKWGFKSVCTPLLAVQTEWCERAGKWMLEMERQCRELRGREQRGSARLERGGRKWEIAEGREMPVPGWEPDPVSGLEEHTFLLSCASDLQLTEGKFALRAEGVIPSLKRHTRISSDQTSMLKMECSHHDSMSSHSHSYALSLMHQLHQSLRSYVSSNWELHPQLKVQIDP